MEHTPYEHFEGKSVAEHLKEARKRGTLASAEIHGTEMPGHFAAAADALKETAMILLILWGLCTHFFPHGETLKILSLFSIGWVLWKTGRSALLGWARIERLHRVIEEERWEIEHHRRQEREELTELYAAKGLQGTLLTEVIDVLMADDNRLLQVMLEEELGLTLEAYEHPLKQAAGAWLGALLSSIVSISAFWIAPQWGLPLAAACGIACGAVFSAKLERNRKLHAAVWNLSLGLLAAGSVYFLARLLTQGS